MSLNLNVLTLTSAAASAGSSFCTLLGRRLVTEELLEGILFDDASSITHLIATNTTLIAATATYLIAAIATTSTESWRPGATTTTAGRTRTTFSGVAARLLCLLALAWLAWLITG